MNTLLSYDDSGDWNHEPRKTSPSLPRGIAVFACPVVASCFFYPGIKRAHLFPVQLRAHFDVPGVRIDTELLPQITTHDGVVNEIV